MKEALRLKSWAGPLTIGSFFVVALTGILMLMHVNFGMTRMMHEAVSCVFVVAAVLHVLVNWNVFCSYFRKLVGVSVIAAFILLAIVSFMSRGRPMGHASFMGPLVALQESSLNLVAQVAKRDLQSVTDELKAKGIDIRDAEQTIAAIASNNGRPPMEILALIVGNKAAPSQEPPKKQES
jgi:hypothetical protein